MLRPVIWREFFPFIPMKSGECGLYWNICVLSVIAKSGCCVVDKGRKMFRIFMCFWIGKKLMMKILHLLKEVGVKVPEDVSLTGWLNGTDQYSNLPITGITQN